MKLSELIHKAAAGYPDARLLAYWDGRQAVSNPAGGDTLAEFIVRELCDTFDAKASTGEQVTEAVRVLNRAKEDLVAVISTFSTAVENSKHAVSQRGSTRSPLRWTTPEGRAGGASPRPSP